MCAHACIIQTKQTELLAYLKRIVVTHKLLEPGGKGAAAGKPIVRLSTEVEEARWDGAARRWIVRAVNNGQWNCGVLACAVATIETDPRFSTHART